MFPLNFNSGHPRSRDDLGRKSICEHDSGELIFKSVPWKTGREARIERESRGRRTKAGFGDTREWRRRANRAFVFMQNDALHFDG